MYQPPYNQGLVVSNRKVTRQKRIGQYMKWGLGGLKSMMKVKKTGRYGLNELYWVSGVNNITNDSGKDCYCFQKAYLWNCHPDHGTHLALFVWEILKDKVKKCKFGFRKKIHFHLFSLLIVKKTFVFVHA